jgi:hypothetical protein
MPRWLSAFLIIVGFLALVAMALLPKNVSVNVTINADDRDVSGREHAAPAESQAPPQSPQR